MASLSAVNFLFDPSSQLLPFWIAIAQNDRELELAAKARQIAYGKHLPLLGEKQRQALRSLLRFALRCNGTLSK